MYKRQQHVEAGGFDKGLLDSAPSIYILEQNLIFIGLVYVRTFGEIKEFLNIIFVFVFIIIIINQKISYENLSRYTSGFSVEWFLS